MNYINIVMIYLYLSCFSCIVGHVVLCYVAECLGCGSFMKWFDNEHQCASKEREIIVNNCFNAMGIGQFNGYVPTGQ